MTIQEIVKIIFNILKTENITGYNSLAHCFYFILVRYFTIEKCKKYNIPLNLAFENLLKDSYNEICDNDTVLLKFYNENSKECLVEYIKNIILKKSSFKLNIKSSTNIINIFNKLN